MTTKKLKKYKKPLVKKFANGVQILGNSDPTTLYEKQRNDTVADTQFNNAEQANLDRANIQQGLADSTSAGVNNYTDAQAGKTANNSMVASGLSQIPGVGQAAAIGYGLGTSTGDKLNQKSFDSVMSTGKEDKTSKSLARVLTPTSSKLLNAKNAVDVGEAFIPLNLGKSSQDIAEEEALNAKRKEEEANKQIEKYGAIDATVQGTQLKKGSKKLKARIIETEGREPIFTPKDSSGKRQLLYHNPNDPTHKEGGVKAAVVSGRDKIRGMLSIPEGSAIVTAENNMNQKALKAYKNGDQKKLNTIINQMPDDKASKKASGVNGLYNPPSINPDEELPYYEDDEQNLEKERVIGKKPIEEMLFGKDRNITITGDKTPENKVPSSNKKKYDTSKLSNLGSGLAQAAPSIYNLGRGLLEKPEQTKRRYVANEGYKYKDLSDPSRRAAEEQMRVESDNIRNATGGQGGSYLANQSLASANRFKNMANINNQEAGRRLEISNMNTGLRNQQNAQNLQLANQYDDLDLQNKARKNDFLGAGLTGLSDLSFNRQTMKNQAEADKIRASTLETNNYEFDMDSKKKVFKQLKGNRYLKVKKK